MKIPSFMFALREDLKNEKQFLPTKGEPKATGYDVRAAFEDRKDLIIKPFDYVKIPLGFRAFCPDGWWLELKPRSSTFAKKNLHALYGTIDEGFEGLMIFAAQYVPPIINGKANPLLEIEFGEALGQLIPVKRKDMEVIEISNEDYDLRSEQRDGARKTGGFGSTSK